ncbi:MAG: hypothetical protein ACE5QF_09585, partial [Thermoplasmata archaeon]
GRKEITERVLRVLVGVASTTSWSGVGVDRIHDKVVVLLRVHTVAVAGPQRPRGVRQANWLRSVGGH